MLLVAAAQLLYALLLQILLPLWTVSLRPPPLVCYPVNPAAKRGLLISQQLPKLAMVQKLHLCSHSRGQRLHS